MGGAQYPIIYGKVNGDVGVDGIHARPDAVVALGLGEVVDERQVGHVGMGHMGMAHAITWPPARKRRATASVTAIGMSSPASK